MRNVIMFMAVVIVANACHAQGLRPRSNLFDRRSSLSEKKFSQDNPSGTNEFDRTFCQQTAYNKAFALKHFLGFEFGKKYESYHQKLKLAKPFRMFDTITLHQSDLDNLSSVALEKKIENVTLESALGEIDKLATLLRREYQIDFCHSESGGSYYFGNDYSEITIKCIQSNGRATGLFLSVRNKAVDKSDYDEKLKADSKKQSAIDIPAEAGADLLSVDKPNVEKMLAAREELEGWPQEQGMGGYNPFLLSVYGTNVQNLVKGCCGTMGDFPPPILRKDETSYDCLLLCEKACNVVFALRRPEPMKSIWECGKGVCLIDPISCSQGLRATFNYWCKYDENGRLVKWGHRTQFAEYVLVTNQHAVISARLREMWAKKHGLTLEQAEKRAKELIEVIGKSAKGGGLLNNLRGPGLQTPSTGLLGSGSLRSRREMRAKQLQEAQAKREAADAEREANRQAQAEADKAQREAERAEQRQQLQAIQEEIKRVREEKAAAEKKDEGVAMGSGCDRI